MNKTAEKLLRLYETVRREGMFCLIDEDFNETQEYWDVVDSFTGVDKVRFVKIANMFAEARSIKEIKRFDEWMKANGENKDLTAFINALIKYESSIFAKLKYSKIAVVLLKLVSPVKSLEKKLRKN